MILGEQRSKKLGGSGGDSYIHCVEFTNNINLINNINEGQEKKRQ